MNVEKKTRSEPASDPVCGSVLKPCAMMKYTWENCMMNKMDSITDAVIWA